MNKSVNFARTFRAVTLKTTLAALMLASLVAASPTLLAKPNATVLPRTSSFRGLTYGEWEAQWWTTAFSIPIVEGNHPLFSGGVVGEHNGVVFLAAVGGGAEVPITISAGQALFLPVINAECSVFEPDPFHGDDAAELRACANGHIDNTAGLFAAVDGVPVNNLQSYRVESPLFVFGPLPADNVLGAPAGTTSPSVDAGFYLLIAPLSVGNHTVQVKGTAVDLNFSIDTTFHIVVK